MNSCKRFYKGDKMHSFMQSLLYPIFFYELVNSHHTGGCCNRVSDGHPEEIYVLNCSTNFHLHASCNKSLTNKIIGYIVNKIVSLQILHYQ